MNRTRRALITAPFALAMTRAIAGAQQSGGNLNDLPANLPRRVSILLQELHALQILRVAGQREPVKGS